MITSSKELVLTGLFSRRVALVTGLSERAIENLHPSHFGAPGHFKFVSGSCGGMYYTSKGVVGLLEALRLAGYVAESAALLTAARLPCAHRSGMSAIAIHAAMLEAGPVGWAAQWEAQSL